MKYFFATAFAVALVMGGPLGARAQSEVTLLAPGGATAPVNKLIPGFAAKTGETVKGTFGPGVGTHARAVKGDAFDIYVVQPPYQDVIDSGNVDKSTETPLATVAVGVAVKKGSPKPDISTPEAVKKMLLDAKSISYPDPKGGAAAGVSFEETLKKMGIADQIMPKVKLGAGGAGAMASVAKGDVEIGLTFMSEMSDPGIDIVGPLPKAISTPTGLVGFVSTQAKDPAAAKAFLKYLSGPEAAAVYKELNMVPGR